MKTKLQLILCAILFASLIGQAQITENFSDGNFTVNPVWICNSQDWLINTAGQLQSNNMVANSVFSASTASTLASSAQWQLYVNLTFNTSSTNYIDVFLTASSADMVAANTVGYFVRIGNTDDEISLYRKSTGGVITKIIDGINGVTNTSNTAIKIKVIRDAANQFTLFRDISGTGNTYVNEGSVTDATFTTSSFFGLIVKQSTASFFQRHFFDDIEVKAYTPDILPPVLKSATVITANKLDVLFDEPVDNLSSQTAANYVANNALGVPVSAVIDATNATLVHLIFGSNFISATNYQLAVNNVKDLSGNAIANGTASFTYYAPYTARQYDVVIDEIMAHPTPVVGLSANDWIELKNTSTNRINLMGWRLSDGNSQSGAMPNLILLPDSFVIVCSSTAAAAMANFGTTISVTNFPSLDNFGGLVVLKSPESKTIHTVNYSDAWYQNSLKKEGGWSLEMIDTKNPCTGITNWKASADLRGGSPGKKNPTDAINPDNNAPKLLKAYTTDSLNIVLVFDEALDSLKAFTADNFNISDGVGIPSVVTVISPAFNKINLQLSTALIANKIYTVTVAKITDCSGNVIGDKNTALVGLPAVASLSDIVINEILFNPPTGGNDYVEIYNRSNKIIDLKQTYIATRNTSGVVTGIAQLSTENLLLFPQSFMVLSENIAMVKAGYITENAAAFLEINAMPLFSNDKGSVIILNGQGEVIDELVYSEKWHFKLIDNKQGVALERISYDAITQSADNWHSAATSVGYGTPGFKNSQVSAINSVAGEIKILPEIISPDNDGRDDFATIDYDFPKPGYVANITIFDASGRPVRYLQQNALCATKGSFRWDGLGNKNQSLSTGVYIIFTEVFNLEGKKKQFKTAIVLARKI